MLDNVIDAVEIKSSGELLKTVEQLKRMAIETLL